MKEVLIREHASEQRLFDVWAAEHATKAHSIRPLQAFSEQLQSSTSGEARRARAIHLINFEFLRLICSRKYMQTTNMMMVLMMTTIL